MSEKKLSVVGLGGSLSEGSTSLKALEIALEGAQEAGADVRLFGLRELSLPMYDPSVKDVPARARELAEAVSLADAMIWSTPLYHGAMSGSFKNALDWLNLLANASPPYLTGKSVGLISAAGGAYAIQGINTMEFVVRALRGFTVPYTVPISQAWRAVEKDGHFRDPELIERLKKLGNEVVWLASRLSQHSQHSKAS